MKCSTCKKEMYGTLEKLKGNCDQCSKNIIKENNAVTIRFTGGERFKIIWLLLWTGEIRLWILNKKHYNIWMEFLKRT